MSEALYYGVPLIVIPQAGDQTWVARRVAQLGAGKLLHRSRIEAHLLLRLADEIISHSLFKRASANIGESLRQAGGYVRAADEIEQLNLLEAHQQKSVSSQRRQLPTITTSVPGATESTGSRAWALLKLSHCHLSIKLPPTILRLRTQSANHV